MWTMIEPQETIQKDCTVDEDREDDLDDHNDDDNGIMMAKINL